MNQDGLSDGKVGKHITKAARDPTYFFPDDFIILKVEDALFRIPLFHILKHLQHSGDLFNSLSRRSADGFSEENPFVVDDISVNEFRHFLRIILPSVTENLETVWTNKNSVTSKDEWLSVLKISTLWHCLTLRSTAIHALESNSLSFRNFSSQSNSGSVTDLTPTERILLGRKYSISSWVVAGYITLVQSGSVSDSEMEAVGAVESFKLMRIIQEAPKSPFRTQYRLDIIIKEAFRAELSSIAPAEKAYSLGPVDGGRVTPQSPLPPQPEAVRRPQAVITTIDPSAALYKLNPPPCNEHYLTVGCSKGSIVTDCNYSHDYALTPDQLEFLAINAKKVPCHWLRTELPCPYGANKCCWGHTCPNGPTCPHFSKGKCRFKKGFMHVG